MTASETPAVVLRRAAARLVELAEATSRDRWEAVENYPDMWVVSALTDQPPVPRTGVRNPYIPSFYVAAEASDGDMQPGDAHYIAALGPQVAAPLSAWLRSEADQFERDGWSDAQGDWPPLAFARTLLGETERTQ